LKPKEAMKTLKKIPCNPDLQIKEPRGRIMNGKDSLSQPELRILGLTRQFDFLIRLSEPGAYHKIINSDIEILATYAHEWTHYIQFLSTSLGNFIAENERNIYFVKNTLVMLISKALAGKFALPISELLHSNSKLLGNSEISHAVETLKILAACRSTVCWSWSKEVNGISLNLEEIRERCPFKIDIESGSLVFICTDGSERSLRVSATQVLEHAAIANELMLGRGIRLRRLLCPELLDYFAFFLFLYQEGEIEFLSIDKDILIPRIPGFLSGDIGSSAASALMYTCCQISLMLYLHPKYLPKNIVEKDSKNELSPKSYKLVEAFRKSSVFAFCTLINNFSLVQCLIDEKLTQSVDSIDKVCEHLGLPKYSKLLQMQLSTAQRTEKDIKQVWSIDLNKAFYKALELESSWKGRKLSPRETDDLERKWSLDLGQLHASYFAQRATIAFEVLGKESGPSIFPLLYADNFPSPYILVESEAGERRMVIRFPWQKQPRVLEIPYDFLRLYYWNDMIINKLFFDKDLACYRTNQGMNYEEARAERAAIGCPHFDSCYKRKKDTLLGFCEFSEWKQGALKMIHYLRSL
jgi:hypothetical protein